MMAAHLKLPGFWSGRNRKTRAENNISTEKQNRELKATQKKYTATSWSFFYLVYVRLFAMVLEEKEERERKSFLI